jgi:hypothetical protein
MEIGEYEWHKYVYDTFILFEPKTNVSDVLHILTNFYPCIKFTHEAEIDHSFSCLDSRVTQSSERQTFEIIIYSKSTFNGHMTKWNSFVPMSYKTIGIDSMIRGGLSICSTYPLLAAEFDEMRRIGRANNYPSPSVHIGMDLSEHLTKKAKTTLSSTTTTTTTELKKKRMYAEMPYVGHTTNSIRSKLAHILSKLRSNLDIRYFKKPPPSVQSFFQNKDCIIKHMQLNIVYSVHCNDCEQT